MKSTKRDLSKPLSSTYGDDDKKRKYTYGKENSIYGEQNVSPRGRKGVYPNQVLVQGKVSGKGFSNGTDTFKLKGNPRGTAWVHTNPKKAGLYNKYAEYKNPKKNYVEKKKPKNYVEKRNSTPNFSNSYMKYKKK